MCALLAALAVPAAASARGGDYAFDGGTARERAAVRAALEASAFPWDVVPRRITVHIARGGGSHAAAGHVWLDARLLAAGRFAWGIVQEEYAHQVDLLLLDDRDRARLLAELGGADWCGETPGLAHGDHGCERFAATLAWAYWPSRHNVLRPRTGADESAAMAPARFRALLEEILGAEL
jgi:hypothetical protein